MREKKTAKIFSKENRTGNMNSSKLEQNPKPCQSLKNLKLTHKKRSTRSYSFIEREKELLKVEILLLHITEMKHKETLI